MENKKSKSSANMREKIVSMCFLVVTMLAFIFSCLKSFLPIGAGIVGTFGLAVYPLLLFLAFLSLAKFLGMSYRRSKKATAFMFGFIISLLFVVHCIRTYSTLDSVVSAQTFKAYLSLSYEKFTVLGSAGSIIAGIISLVVGGIGAIVLFVILATLTLGLFVDFELYGKYEQKHIKNLKSRKIREKVNKSDFDAVNGNPKYSFSDETKTYNENDVVSEISTDVSDYVSENQAHSDESVENFQVEANPDNYAQSNTEQNYSDINFFAGNDNYAQSFGDYGQVQQNGYSENVNPFGVDAVTNNQPAFSNDVYSEETYPNVFTDSLDEHRRKFMQDTFGGAQTQPIQNSQPENANLTTNFSVSNNFSNQSSESDFSQKTEPSITHSNDLWGSDTSVSESSQVQNFNQSNSENSSLNTIGFSFSENDIKDSQTSSSNSSSNFDSLNSDSSTSDDDFDLSKLFSGLSDETSSESGVEKTDDDDMKTENDSVYGLNFNDTFSQLLNSDSSESSKPSESLNQSQNKDESPNFDFSFLNDKDDSSTFIENSINDDIQTNFSQKNPTISPNEQKFSNQTEQSKNDSNLSFGNFSSGNSNNGFSSQKVVVQAKEPQKKVSGFNLGMNGIRYNPPPLSLLRPAQEDNGDYTEEQQRKSSRLEDALKAFNIPAKVVNIIRGPKITRFELSVPLGVPVKKIPMYELDIKRALAAKTINIQAPIPGSSYVGIELENDTFTSVSQRELFESDAFQNCKDPLAIAVGKDISGEIVVKSLAKMVHLLIAGSTGSGKSVFIHSLVMSLIYKHSPEDLRLIMIDPKKVEFNRYNGLPHLLTPEVVMGSDKAINALKWCVKEMDRRYDLMSKSGYNNIEPYNRSELVKAGQFEKFPYIVIIVDELAEIMMVNKKEVEGCIQRITQLARACGMHLVLATQRPSVDIISGVIKNNVPSRIAFSLSSGIDSKTILNTVGAEKLLGQGDMLFSPNGTASMPRLQAAYCSDEEIKAVIDYDKQNNSANYDEEVSNVINAEQQEADEFSNQSSDMPAPRELDGYFKTAVKIVMQNGGASTSYLQRRLAIGYSRAAKIIDQMEDRGYIAPATGSKLRKVLITPDQFKQDFNEDYNDDNEI